MDQRLNQKGIDRDTLAIIALIGGPPAIVTYILYRAAEASGGKLRMEDFLPLSPAEGLPIPRVFKYKKDKVREIFEEIRIVEKAKR